MNWNEIVAKVTPYIVKIETPQGHGTGFLCLYSANKNFCGIATARHVVGYADDWQQPIRLQHYPSSTTVFLKEADRVVYPDPETDSAIMLFRQGDLQLPEEPIPLLPITVPLAIGAEVGWLGFPAIADATLCFFSGTISARQEHFHRYLIDGVAINGVSGGPVVYSTATEGVQIVGTISAYVSNRATGSTLPGLSIAHDVSHFHDTITSLKSLEEAKQQKQTQNVEPESEPTIPPAASAPNDAA